MSKVRMAMIEEMRGVIAESQKLHYKMTSAKTLPKRKIYKKKLKKNNEYLADLTVALERIPAEQKVEEIQQEVVKNDIE